MHPAIAIPLALTLALAVACLVYWSVALVRVYQALRRLPTLRHGAALPLPDPSPTVCAVIPAHNEAGHIAQLIRTLADQDYPALHVVLACDRCTDNTVALAREAVTHAGAADRFTILEITSCPDDWAGKTNAIWQAVQRAPHASSSDLLLFADADTRFDPSCLRAAVALLHHRKLDLLSILSTLSARHWFERVIQPAASLELLRQYPMHSSNRYPNPRPFANGQFLLFRAEAYRAVGGHEAVKDDLLEDIALARAIGFSDRRPGVLLAAGLLTCHMYESFPDFRRGWKRIYTEAANRRAPRLASLAWRVRFSNCILPLAALATLILSCMAPSRDLGADVLDLAALLVSSLALLAYFTAMFSTLRAQRAPLWAAFLQPFAALSVASILSEAARDLRSGRATAWGGRNYVLQDRGHRPPTSRIPITPPLSEP
ncbi:MAG: glycosyltransferase family 2 protein [Phycisphaerales bacterium]